MKKIVLISIFYMLTNWVKAAEIQGKIILLDGTKLNNVTLHIPEFKALGIKRPYYEKLQEKIKYVDPSTRENVYITADKAKEIRFMYDYHEICMVSVSTVSKKPLFLKLTIADGEVKLYHWYYQSINRGNTFLLGKVPENTDPNSVHLGAIYSVLQKGDEFVAFKRPFFPRKKMMKYFADCPEVLKKLESKEWRIRDMYEIVEFYNATCATNPTKKKLRRSDDDF